MGDEWCVRIRLLHHLMLTRMAWRLKLAGDKQGHLVVCDVSRYLLLTLHSIRLATQDCQRPKRSLSRRAQSKSSQCTRTNMHQHPVMCWYAPASPRAGACSAGSSQAVALAGIQSQLTERSWQELWRAVTVCQKKVGGREITMWRRGWDRRVSSVSVM